MTEITRVPLQPIARGALPALWLGVLAAGLLAVGVAAGGKPPLVDVKTLTAGTGPSPTATDIVIINYVGQLADGKVFDQAQSAIMPVNGVVPGFAKALEQMQVGGKYDVKIPAALGYGEHSPGPIPPNSDLRFKVELVNFTSAAAFAEMQRRMEMMRQMQGQQGQPGGGAPAPAHQ